MLALTTALLLAPPPTGFDEGRPPDAEARVDLARLQGEWSAVSGVTDGRPVAAETIRATRLIVGAEVFAWREGESLRRFGVLKLDPSAEPNAVDVNVLGGDERGGTLEGIYRIADDEMTLCLGRAGDGRPETFDPPAEAKRSVYVFRKDRPPEGRRGDLSGKYVSVAQGTGGPDVEGEADIRRVGESYLVRYSQAGRVTYVGVGVRTGDVLSVSWSSPDRGEIGLSVYRIGRDGGMTGHYSKLGGAGVLQRESLTPKPVIE